MLFRSVFPSLPAQPRDRRDRRDHQHDALANGDYDHIPEQAFFMCGGLDDVERKAAELAKS